MWEGAAAEALLGQVHAIVTTGCFRNPIIATHGTRRRELTTAAGQGSTTARQAIAIFCRSIAKTAAGYAAVLDGLDSLVFTGGIGEHSALVREQVCRQLAFLGIAVDSQANHRNASVISQKTSPIRVQIIPADEDGRIAHHVRILLAR